MFKTVKTPRWLAAIVVTLLAVSGCSQTGTVAMAEPVAQPENILVVGASGRSGVYIIRELKAQNRNFTPMTSNVERAEGKVPGDYKWVAADVRDPAALQEIMQGRTHVISALGATQFKGPNSPEFIDWEGTRNIVDAAKQAGVQQIIIVSAAGVTQQNHSMNRLGAVMTFKLRAEDYLRDSGIPYTIVRPGGLESEESTGRQVYLHQGDDLPNHGGFSRADLATLLISALDNPAAYNKSFEPIYDTDADVTGIATELDALLTDAQLKAQK